MLHAAKAVDDIEPGALGANPHAAVAVFEKRVDAVGESHRLADKAATARHVAHKAAVGIEQCQLAIVRACPYTPLAVVHQRAHLLPREHGRKLEVMIAEVDKVDVARAREPQVSLFVKHELVYLRQVGVGAVGRLQHIRHELAGGLIVIAECAFGRNHPHRAVGILVNKRLHAGSAVQGAVGVGHEPAWRQVAAGEQHHASRRGESPDAVLAVDVDGGDLGRRLRRRLHIEHPHAAPPHVVGHYAHVGGQQQVAAVELLDGIDAHHAVGHGHRLHGPMPRVEEEQTAVGRGEIEVVAGLCHILCREVRTHPGTGHGHAAVGKNPLAPLPVELNLAQEVARQGAVVDAELLYAGPS